VRERVDVKVEVLYFKGCPNHQPVVEQVRQVLRSEQINVPVDEVEVMPENVRFGLPAEIVQAIGPAAVAAR